MFQGLKELRERNWQDPPFNTHSVNAVLITHAHIDHTGYLPRLVKLGFSGPVYCSRGTADLLKILLPDAGRLQEEEADYTFYDDLFIKRGVEETERCSGCAGDYQRFRNDDWWPRPASCVATSS